MNDQGFFTFEENEEYEQHVSNLIDAMFAKSSMFQEDDPYYCSEFLPCSDSEIVYDSDFTAEYGICFNAPTVQIQEEKAFIYPEDPFAIDDEDDDIVLSDLMSRLSIH